MAQKVTFEALKSALHATIVVSYKAGWDNALTIAASGATNNTEARNEPSSAISEYRVLPSVIETKGAFHDDPTWDNFMENIEEYSNYINALERGQ